MVVDLFDTDYVPFIVAINGLFLLKVSYWIRYVVNALLMVIGKSSPFVLICYAQTSMEIMITLFTFNNFL